MEKKIERHNAGISDFFMGITNMFGVGLKLIIVQLNYCENWTTNIRSLCDIQTLYSRYALSQIVQEKKRVTDCRLDIFYYL